MAKAVEGKIEEMIAADVAAMGYDLVRVHLSGNGKYAAVQIMAERVDRAAMTVEDCAALSRMITEKMEADQSLAGKYDLEVSSPGIDRPLMKLADYERFLGHVAKVDLLQPVEGRRRLQGKIVAVTAENIEFSVDKQSLSVAFAAIDKAKLVLTDELLKAAASGAVTH